MAILPIDPKCGYCFPCFDVTDLEVKPALPHHGTGERFWELSYTLCLKDVKCDNRFTPTIFRIKPSGGTGGTPGAFVFSLKDDEICITDDSLATYSPKVCCKIPPAESPIFEPKPIQFFPKYCCNLLFSAIRTIQTSLSAKKCKKGTFNFEVDTGDRSPQWHDIHMHLITILPLLVGNYWKDLIGDLSTHNFDDFGFTGTVAAPLADLYNSDDWSQCLKCPEGCAE